MSTPTEQGQPAAEASPAVVDGLVSIIMPSYNVSRFIARSIESIMAQTYPNWELLIADDHSDDATTQVATAYAARDSRICVFSLPENKGAGRARNHAIERSRGRYIAFCDSDDCWLPTKLETQIKFMRSHDCALSYSSYFTCSDTGLVNGLFIASPRLTLSDLKHDNKIGCLTAMLDVTKCGKVYMPLMRKRQDWAYFLTIMKQHPLAHGITHPLAVYRIRHNSVSQAKLPLIKYNAQVYCDVFGYSRPHAYAYLFCVFMPHYFAKRIQTAINRHRYRSLWQDAQMPQAK